MGVLPAPGGVVFLPGGCLLRGRGFSLPGEFSLPGGVVSLPRGGSHCLGGGFSLPGDPPVNRITHMCKNITLATTSLRPVKMIFIEGMGIASLSKLAVLVLECPSFLYLCLP